MPVTLNQLFVITIGILFFIAFIVNYKKIKVRRNTIVSKIKIANELVKAELAGGKLTVRRWYLFNSGQYQPAIKFIYNKDGVTNNKILHVDSVMLTHEIHDMLFNGEFNDTLNELVLNNKHEVAIKQNKRKK